MKTNKSLRGIAWWAGAATATTMGIVACGSDFSDGDCKSSRTCAAAGGDGAVDGGAPSGNAPSAGGTDGGDAPGQASGGAADAVPPPGGAGGATTVVEAGGAGGAPAPEPECRVAKDCSNSDPSDGEELCKNGSCAAGNPPPTVVSVSPKDKAVAVEPDGSIVITFSEALDSKTVTEANVQVLDGATAIPTGKPTYADGKVTLKPAAPLALLTPYSVSVSATVTDAEGAALLAPFKSTFTVRDGTWKTIDAVKDTLGAVSDALPIAADGRVMLAWSGTSSTYCPVFGRWFLRGEHPSDAKSFAIAGQSDCGIVSSAGNAAGEVAVMWNEHNVGSYAPQFRAGAWPATPTLVSSSGTPFSQAIAVAPNGAVTYFEHLIDTSTVWTTDAAGTWPSDGEVISTFYVAGRTSTSFDSKGNGLAVWKAIQLDGTNAERVVISSLAAGTGKWTTAQALVGTVTTIISPTTAQRGIPVVAMDDKAGAMVLWTDVSAGKLMASRYTAGTGWAAAESINGAPAADISHEAPALVFDGKAFVAAWTAKEGTAHYTYSARYELGTGWGIYRKHQLTVADGTSAVRMPRLVTDGRGHLLLVYATGTAPNFTLMYQRYANDAWSAITAVPDGAFVYQDFENDDVLPLSMSSNGLAALAWTERANNGTIAAIRLASFF